MAATALFPGLVGKENRVSSSLEVAAEATRWGAGSPPLAALLVLPLPPSLGQLPSPMSPRSTAVALCSSRWSARRRPAPIGVGGGRAKEEGHTESVAAMGREDVRPEGIGLVSLTRLLIVRGKKHLRKTMKTFKVARYGFN